MPTPIEHVSDAHQLQADGVVDLFELSPLVGGTVYFKPDNTVTWRSNEYVGLPCALTDWKKSSDSVSTMPKLVIGNENVDLAIFKPLIWDGYLDGATLVYKRVLLDHLLSNFDIKDTQIFRIKRPESYSRTKIVLQLSTSSDALNFTIPSQQYYPPDFPTVML